MLQLVNKEEGQIAIPLTMTAVEDGAWETSVVNLLATKFAETRRASGCLQLPQKPSPIPKFSPYFP